MAVLGRLLVSSAERLDLPDFLSVDSYTQGDFKYLMRSFVGSDKPYILKGFEVINPDSALGTANISIKVADSVAYYPTSSAGPFFHGLEEGNALAAPLVPELRKNTTNYVYLTFTTVDAAKDTRAFWDPDKEGGVGGEFSQDVNTETVLQVDVNVSASSFPEDTIPVCKVEVGPSFIESIEDARDMMFRLGSGGLNPNPLSRYGFRSLPSTGFERSEPSTIMSSALDANPFQGGDKNIYTLKEWMDVVMTKLAELGGTTFWYEDTGAYSIINIFRDALATSIKSKGNFESSAITPGLLTWSEDIILQSVSDDRDIIIRAGNATLADNETLYIKQERDLEVNSGDLPLTWINGSDWINGDLGAFENLEVGDWVHKGDDPGGWYRVEALYFGADKSGGAGAPAATALSVEIHKAYEGTSDTKASTYSKGLYSGVSEILTADRNDPDVSSAGGNLHWLAFRSDTILSVTDAVGTELTGVDISNHDGERALVTSVGHGLSDKQRIAITDSAAGFNGTYKIEVVDADNFYIDITGGPFADESGVANVRYATITTGNRLSSGGIELESSTHGFTIDQLVTIAGNAAAHNGEWNVFPTGATTFTIPVTAIAVSTPGGTANSVNIYLRTNFGPEGLEQGEIKQINEGPTDNLRSFIGMENESQTYPAYSILPTYNTLKGLENYNTLETDNVVDRLSKLTAMMSDKAQDKTVKLLLEDTDEVTNTQNATAQEITFTSLSGGTPTMNVTLPSSQNNGTVTMTGTLSLEANEVAYFTIDRNASFSVANLGALTVSNITEVPVDENIYIFAIRLSGQEVWLWDSTRVDDSTTIPLGPFTSTIANQDRNLKLIGGGTWSWDLGTTSLSYTADAYIQIPGIANDRNEIDIADSPIVLASDGDVAYVDINRASPGVAGTISPVVVAVASFVPTSSRVVIARRVGSEVLVGQTFLLIDGESKTLDAGVSDNLLNIIPASSNADSDGQLRLKENSASPKRVNVTGISKTTPDGTEYGAQLSSLLLDFTGAQVDFDTGTVYKDDGVTPLGIDFTPATIAANQYRWYSITLIPSTVGANNEIGGQLIVLAGDADGATAELAPKAAFASGTRLGQVVVQESGGSIANITQSNIIQLSATGSGSGDGDASTLLGRLEDQLDDSSYEAFTPNIFSIHEDTRVESATATFSFVDQGYDFSAAAENIVSTQMLDTLFLSEYKDLDEIQLTAFWKTDEIDNAATYEVSRDGGNEYQAVTMEQVGDTGTFVGSHTFADEAANQSLVSQATNNASLELNATTQQKIGQSFTLTNASVAKEVDLNITVNGSPTGLLYVSIVNDDTSLPSTDINDIQADTAAIDISTLSTGTLTVTLPTVALAAGTYHLAVRTDADYKTSFVTATTSIELSTDSGGSGASSYNGTIWASATGGLVFDLQGRELNLKVRITSSQAALLEGYGIFFDDAPGENVTNIKKVHTVTFNGTNQDTFTLSWLPDPDTLTVYEVQTGQAYTIGAFALQGHDVVFPANTFNEARIYTLRFLEVGQVGTIDNSDLNASLMAANFLGSTDGTIDRSSSGRGILLRSDTGKLIEVTVKDLGGGNFDIKFYEIT